MANKTINISDKAEFSRVFHSVTAEEFDKARERLVKDPRAFYAELVVLLWSAEDLEDCGTDYAENDVVRDIFDVIQGIAARDTATREFNSKHC